MLRVMKPLVCILAVAPLVADTTFQVRRNSRSDVPLSRAQCDIRLQIDGEVEVYLEGDRVTIRTISGRDGADDGSECTHPLPRARVNAFGFEVRDRRNDIQLLSEPSPRNDYRAVVAIRDSSGGMGRYHFRIAWDRTGGSEFDRFPRTRDPIPFGGAVDYDGRGDGNYRQRITRATIRVSPTGQVNASFDYDRGGRLTFTGRVTRQEADTIYADVTDGTGQAGSMTIVVDGAGRVRSATVNGRDNYTLEWRR
jgi:hypothetical protein